MNRPRSADRNAESIRRGIAAVGAALEESRAQAEAGAPVDLAGLDTQVAQLCEAALALPPGKARGLLEGLRALLATLDALAAAIARQRDALAAAAEGRTDPHTARQRAAAAYGRGAPPAGIAVAAPQPPSGHEPASPDEPA